MIYMCLEIEKEETKLFQFFPLRTDIIMKHIQIDTKSLTELFTRENKGKLLNDIENNKDEIWNKFFKLNEKVFNQNNYKFDYVISTNCYSVSIKMLNKKNVKEEQKKKTNKRTKNMKIRKKQKI